MSEAAYNSSEINPSAVLTHTEERLKKATLANKKRSMKRQLAPLLALLFTGLSAIAEQKTVNISRIILKKLSTKFEAAKVSDPGHAPVNCNDPDLRADGFRIDYLLQKPAT